MEILKVGRVLNDSDKRKIKETLQSGGVIMHATETCYGFACDFFQPQAWKRLFEVKKMDMAKPVSVMVQDLHEAEQYGVFDATARKLAEHFWPGPLTIIVPRTSNLPGYVNEGNSTVGLRCPDFVLVHELLALNGRPLCTTSANISGEPEVYRAEDYLAQTEHHIKIGASVNLPDLLLDSGVLPINLPSTIVRGTEILRRGNLAEKVEEFF